MTTKPPKTSVDSMIEASRYHADFSGHTGALGAAGFRMASDHPENCVFLTEPGSSIFINPKDSRGFESLFIGVAWDNVPRPEAGFFEKLLKKVQNKGVDLDLGCLYELQDGTRGAIQAFGDKFGAYDAPPYIGLSGDERTGDGAGHDEHLSIKGLHWNKIKRIVVYLYIYEGAARWSEITPQIVIDVPGEDDLILTLKAHDDALGLCAVGGLENVQGGIKLTNYTEYFPGHAEMDRAFGFGLAWGDGQKA